MMCGRRECLEEGESGWYHFKDMAVKLCSNDGCGMFF
jgi:hypothetical protein